MKINLLLLLLTCMCGCVSAQSDIAVARWMPQPVTIEGVNTEWGSLNFYDDNTELNFAIGNDAGNIYLCFECTDEAVEMKMMRAGMKITLATKGKFKHEASIVFPLPQSKQTQAPPPANDQSNSPSNAHPVFNKITFRENFINNHALMQATGFATINGNVPVKDSAVQLALNWDSASNLIYEVSISKKELFGADYALKKDMGDITLNVEVNALQHLTPGGENGKEGYAGGMHGGSGMHVGNGSNGGDFNNSREKYTDGMAVLNNSNKAQLGVKTSFKQKFSLSSNGN